MNLASFRSDLLSHVPGVIAASVGEDMPAGASLPAMVCGQILIDEGRFDRTAFESILRAWAPDYVAADDTYRGTLENGLARFRITLAAVGRVAKPRRGFLFIGTVSDVEGDTIAEEADRKILCACEHLLDAATATERADSPGAALAVASARNSILGTLAILAFRSVKSGDICAPFGPYRTAAAAMIAANEPIAAFGATLDAIEATRLLSADVRSAGEPPLPPALRILRRFTGADAACGRRPSWYGANSVAIYDESRDFPDAVIECLRQVVTELRARTCAELGCGTGRISLALASLFDRIYAIDSSAEMLVRLREKDPERGIGRIVPLMASMGATGLPDGSVDIVVEFEAFFLFPNPARLSREVARILSPAGVVLRLVKLEGGDPHAEEILKRFDETVATRSLNGVCFVGDNIDAEMDIHLKTQGIQTTCFEIFSMRAERTVDDLLASRRRRSFPYLEHIPETVLQEADLTARENVTSEKVEIWSSYYLLVGFRGQEDGRMERVAGVLGGLGPGRARRMPGVPLAQHEAAPSSHSL